MLGLHGRGEIILSRVEGITRKETSLRKARWIGVKWDVHLPSQMSHNRHVWN